MTRATRARSLRRRDGRATACVWALLRAGRTGHKFKRERPIGPYVADFACDALRLVIEIDGGVHGLPEVALRDEARQRDLEELGWTVLRLSDVVAMARTTEIVEAVHRHAAGLAGRPERTDPHPALRATFSQWEKEG